MGMVVFISSSGRVFSIGGAVGIVTIDGPIISADGTLEDIERFRKDDAVKSVVLRLESPGGSVAASQEIFEAVKGLAKEKPVVASMGSIATSGAYYIACGTTKLLASPGTATGSIGVRMEHIMIGDLLKWARIGHETLKSGRFKDLASMDRPMTPEERAIIQGVLVDLHEQFKETVSDARGLEKKDVDRIADGRFYTGRQALELGLIDEIGGLTEATKLAATLGGIKGEPRLIHPEKRYHLIERLLNSATSLMTGRLVVPSSWWQPMMIMHLRP